MDNRLSIVVVSCDKYEDIVRYYLFYLKAHWPNCDYNIYVAEEEIDLHSEIATTVLCGKGANWTKAAITTINSTDSQYILLSNDDYYIYKDIDGKEIKKVLDFIMANGIKYYRFPHAAQKGKRYEKYKENVNVERIPTTVPYGITIGTAIWERNEILRILGDGTKSAWDLESDFSRQATLGKKGQYYNDYVSDRRDLLHYVHMATWGKWIPSAARTLKEHGHCEIDYSQRGFVSRRSVFKFRVYGVATRIIPVKMRAPIKRLLSKIGFKFATMW